jgi:hypothetical protein
MKNWVISILIGLISCPAFGGWSENVRLTYRGNEICPQVIARYDTVHVVWKDNSATPPMICYIRSSDAGNSWGAIVDLNESGHRGWAAPTLNLAERGLLVSWLDYNENEGISSIAIAKSVDGTTWSAPSYIWTDNPNRFNQPVSAVKGDSIILAYYSYRNDSTGSQPFRAMHSYNYGATWSDEVTVGYPYSVEALPTRMKYCFGTLLFAYSGNPDSTVGGVHIIGYRSTDAGRTWSDTIWVSPNTPNWSLSVCLSCNKQNGNLAAGYTDYRYQVYAFHGDIFAAISSNEGFTWLDEYQATNSHTAWVPSIDYVEDTIVTTCSDMRYYPNGYHEIVFNRSNNGGLTWLGEERITYTPDESYDPWISFDNGKIHVVWTEDVPNSGYETFYKKYIPDSSDNIEQPHLSPPSDFTLSAYPNPFNSSLSITVSSNEFGILDIYDLGGRIVRQYPFEKGNQRIAWDGRAAANQPLSSGTYFIGWKGEIKKTIKVVYLK